MGGLQEPNALRLLERYRHRLPSFNDDIQGTGATVLAGVQAASGILGTPLAGLRFVIVGAGAAGIGIGRLLSHALAAEALDPRTAVLLLDQGGIVHAGRQDLSREKAECAVETSAVPAALLAAGGGVQLPDIIDAWRPQVLIGTTAVQGRFNEATIRALGRVAARPVVLALSNPITACEVTPAEVYAWTQGRAIVATGSPFDPVEVDGHLRAVGQGNNAFVFPGLGLGAIVAEAREVTDAMLVAAAQTLAASVSAERQAADVIYPPIADLPKLARAIACVVVREARDSGVGRVLKDDEIEPAVAAAMWDPVYRPYRPER